MHRILLLSATSVLWFSSAFQQQPLLGGQSRCIASKPLFVRGGKGDRVAVARQAVSNNRQLKLPSDSLPDGPSLSFVLLLVANTLMLTPFALAGAAIGLCVQGSRFAIDASSTLIAVIAAASWSLIEWLLPVCLPAQAKKYEAVNAHTELFVATTFGTQRGGIRRIRNVVAGSAVVSASAGICEELVFRGTAQRLTAACLCAIISPPAAHACAIVLVSTIFGRLHNYCQGYALFATLAGIFFGALYYCTENLYVVSLTHALIDFATFLFAYFSVLTADKAKREDLLKRDFEMINKLRILRYRLDLFEAMSKKRRHFTRRQRSLNSASTSTSAPAQ